MPPRTISCYVCGRGFGSSSISIHIPKCLTKFTNAQKSVTDKRFRMVAPQAPPQEVPGANAKQDEVDAYNAAAEAVYKSIMPACPGCKRTFEDFDRLQVHLQSCKKQAPEANSNLDHLIMKSTGGAGEGGSGGKKGGPKMVTCHVCGKGFGLKSLEIHLPQCLSKFENRQQAVTDSRLRTAAPTAPDLPLPGTSASAEEVEAYNAAAEAAYRESMPACPGCGRKFEDAERVEVHMRSCKKAGGAEDAPDLIGMGGGGGGGGGDGFGGRKGGPRMVSCYACGRGYGLASVEKHIPQCLKKHAQRQMAVTDSRLRTAAPTAPDLPLPGTSASAEEVEAYNAAAEAAYRESMPACPGCGRKFEDAERVEVHMRSCKACKEAAAEGKAPDLIGGGGGGFRLPGSSGNPQDTTAAEDVEEEDIAIIADTSFVMGAAPGEVDVDEVGSDEEVGSSPRRPRLPSTTEDAGSEVGSEVGSEEEFDYGADPDHADADIPDEIEG